MEPWRKPNFKSAKQASKNTRKEKTRRRIGRELDSLARVARDASVAEFRKRKPLGRSSIAKGSELASRPNKKVGLCDSVNDVYFQSKRHLDF